MAACITLQSTDCKSRTKLTNLCLKFFFSSLICCVNVYYAPVDYSSIFLCSSCVLFQDVAMVISVLNLMCFSYLLYIISVEHVTMKTNGRADEESDRK